jgi:hypothetical protein
MALPAAPDLHPRRPAGARPRRARLHRTLIATFLVSLPAAALPAQDVVSVAGTVRSEQGGVPLASARVAIAGTPLGILTDARGRFLISGVPVGEQVVEASYLGHQQLRVPVVLVGGTPQRLELVLAVEAVVIEGVEVSGVAALSPALQGFYHRRERGGGIFFTGEEVAGMRARGVTDIIRRVPGVRVTTEAAATGARQTVHMGRSAGAAGARGCQATYFVNGMPFLLTGPQGINAFVRPDEIAGVEIYAGASRLPAQFNTGTQASRCGVIVIWTRSGPRH